MAINDKPKVLIDESFEENSGEDEEEEFRDEHQKPLIECDSKVGENSIPLSIGKIKIFKPRRRNRFFIKRYFKMCSMISVIIFFILYFYRLKDSFYLSNDSLNSSQTNCDRLQTTLVWNKTFPMLTIESALRLVDVDNDTVLDVIVPFGTGLDASSYDQTSCQIYFNQTKDDNSGCGGGVMAINGRTGDQMWTRYTPHELFASNCNIDISGDGIKDCILGGRMAGLFAIDGSKGNIIWSVDPNSKEPIEETSNFYTPLYVPRDVDEDGIPDIVVMHGGDPLRKPDERPRRIGRLLIMSAKTGKIISWSYVPDNSESYYSPQLLIHPDKTLLILFGTGGETHGGALYRISFEDLINGKMQNSRAIYQDLYKGVMVPPVLIDINNDDVFDLIMSLFNSTVIAFDGLEFKEIWRTEFPKSETYSTPAVGFFNNDSIPDFAVLYQYGPGFPVYYSAQFTVLDGRNGKQLLEKPIEMVIGTQSSPLTISTTAKNDLFLYWYSSCQTFENTTSLEKNVSQQFKIAPGTTIHDNSRADFCKLRFNSTLFTQFRALSPTNTSLLYDSRDYKITNSTNYTKIGLQWIQENMAQNDFFDDTQQNTGTEQQLYSPYEEYPPKQRNPYSDGLFDHNYDTQSINYDRMTKTRRRYKRHVGVHDGEGIQRVISTGTLAPPLNNNLETIDVIFATFWFPPSKNVKLLSPEVEECFNKFMDPREESRLRFEEKGYFKQKGFDHDSYVETVRELCAQNSDKRMQFQTDSIGNGLVKDMGELTLFRLNLKCVSDKKSSKVGAIKEYSQQLWPSYMGADADCIVKNDFTINVKQ